MNPVSCADENLDPAVTWYMLYKRNLCPVCMKSHIFSSFYCLSKVRTWHSLTCLVSEDRRQVVGWLHCVQDLMLLPHTLTTTLHHMYSDVPLNCGQGLRRRCCFVFIYLVVYNWVNSCVSFHVHRLSFFLHHLYPTTSLVWIHLKFCVPHFYSQSHVDWSLVLDLGLCDLR